MPSTATSLYKSVSLNGTIQFSDVPPEDVRQVEKLHLPGSSPSGSCAAEPDRDFEAVLERANSQLELAEHALALSRRAVWSETEILHLHSPRRSRADLERVEYFKHGVVVARQVLMEPLRQRPRMLAPQDPVASYYPAPDSGVR